MTKTIEEMKEHIAECYYDSIDLKALLREEYSRIANDLEAWTDSDIEKEYKELTDE